ncbi:MAG: STAS domain-containing protein [Eggerthellaceae bacterium]|nr:STAS domain-containing protein [Eggerthellaceae bacterium]MBQ9067498.1 STAS domain-containing protein [Eggerthellaceae bacterium]
MELTTNKDGAKLTISVNGEVNTMTAPELSALLKKELPGVQELTLDFAKCDYVSSAGLRVLLNTYKQMRSAGGTMQLVNVDESIMDVLQNTGLDAVFGL